jgi:hypothetical protein
MRKLVSMIYIALLIGLLNGCGVSQSDYDSLNAENEKLRKEIDDLRYGADKLLLNAKAYLEKKDYVRAKKELEVLVKTHSGSKQAAEAESMLLEIEQVMPGIQEVPEVINADTLTYAAGQMRTVFDEGKGFTWYYDKNTPKNKNTNCIFLYFGKKSNERPWLRFRIQYAADDQLFIQGYTIKTENSSYRINVKPAEVETNNTGRESWECYDTGMTPSLYVIVNAIIYSETATISYIGKQYYDERTITENEKQELKNVLSAFKAAGGHMNFR